MKSILLSIIIIIIIIKTKKTKIQLDGILIETTGVADPGPVVQTFYTDTFEKEVGFLDGVITVADAKFVAKHLDEKVRVWLISLYRTS